MLTKLLVLEYQPQIVRTGFLRNYRQSHCSALVAEGKITVMDRCGGKMAEQEASGEFMMVLNASDDIAD
ncbi:hypothetical protein CEXT_603591 [Caerostris extrusa]|uniref:Uncharacterized protein n=1 Tax=Caerostris extrusa TaxID=172846 RepID=A0AAV4PRJ3_CAEEX|nr:hypothetical protein CEXT_603591 [Caerostris extrusa]